MNGVADDQVGDAVAAKQAADGLAIQVGGLAMEGQERLGKDPEGVGDGNANAAVADVKGQDALGRRGLAGIARIGAGAGWVGVGHGFSVEGWSS